VNTDFRLKDAVFSFSLANLCLLNIWSAVLSASLPPSEYFRKSSADLSFVWATLVVSGLASLGFWILIQLARRVQSVSLNRLMESGLLLLLVIPLGTALRETVLLFESAGVRNFIFATTVVIKLALITAALFVVLTPSRLALRWAKACVFLMTPLAFVILASIARARLSADLGRVPQMLEQQELKDLSGLRRTGIRLLILVFDEFDQYLAFERRPKSVSLPELDRLRQASVFGTNAYPAARETLAAIPAMTTGKRVLMTKPMDATRLLLTFEDGHSRLWGNEPTLFSTAAETGRRVGLAGWYHPYCRTLTNSFVECYWEQGLPEECFNESNLLKGSANILRRLRPLLTLHSYLGIAQTLPSLPEDVAAVRQVQLESYRNILRASLRMAADPTLDLIFVHWPIPHPFGIYNRQTGHVGTHAANDYLDNLELVDHTLVLIREALETSRMWDSTALLITGDHPFRKETWKDPPWYDKAAHLLEQIENPRVPFLLKLPDQKTGMRYAGSFNLVLLHGISLALLRGEVSTAAEFVHWMDRHRAQRND
jgi:hypothetical protein